MGGRVRDHLEELFLTAHGLKARWAVRLGLVWFGDGPEVSGFTIGPGGSLFDPLIDRLLLFIRETGTVHGHPILALAFAMGLGHDLP